MGAGRRGAAVSIRGVRVVRGRVTLGPADFALSAGQYGCVLGPPGAGKTLLLRAIAGLVRCGGTVALDGAALGSTAPGRRGMALLAQEGAAAPLGSVRAVLRAWCALRGGALAPLLDAFGLAGLAGADPARLDAAQTLRLRLACAFAAQPRLLLLDEPFGRGIDRRAAIDLVRGAAAQSGTTVLHATTERADAFALADHLVLLEAGRVLQAGSAAALYERPASLAVALRAGPGNVLAGRIAALADDEATIALSCGPVIAADPPAEAVVGAACQVLLRPERISVSALSTAELGEGAIAGVLREAVHLGDTIRLKVAIGTDTDLVIARPAGLGARGLIAGRGVSVAWQSRHALTFPG